MCQIWLRSDSRVGKKRGGYRQTDRQRDTAALYSRWQPLDGSRLASGFVLGTASKYFISFKLARVKRCYYTLLVYKLFTQRTYSDMQIFIFLKWNVIVITELELCRYGESTPWMAVNAYVVQSSTKSTF